MKKKDYTTQQVNAWTGVSFLLKKNGGFFYIGIFTWTIWIKSNPVWNGWIILYEEKIGNDLLITPISSLSDRESQRESATKNKQNRE